MRREDNLQVSVFDWLTRHGLYAFHIKNQGKWSPAYGAKLKRMGRRKGMLDLQVITEVSAVLPRGIFMIECKPPPAVLPSGKLSKAKPAVSEDQDKVIAELAARGIPTLIIRGVDELERALKHMGVPFRGRLM